MLFNVAQRLSIVLNVGSIFFNVVLGYIMLFNVVCSTQPIIIQVCLIALNVV